SSDLAASCQRLLIRKAPSRTFYKARQHLLAAGLVEVDLQAVVLDHDHGAGTEFLMEDAGADGEVGSRFLVQAPRRAFNLARRRHAAESGARALGLQPGGVVHEAALVPALGEPAGAAEARRTDPLYMLLRQLIDKAAR